MVLPPGLQGRPAAPPEQRHRSGENRYAAGVSVTNSNFKRDMKRRKKIAT